MSRVGERIAALPDVTFTELYDPPTRTYHVTSTVSSEVWNLVPEGYEAVW
jgi:hypothetical protein